MTRTRLGLMTLVVLVSMAFAGCATPRTAYISDPQCAGETRGDWVLGEWSNQYNTLLLRRDGPSIRWTLKRVRHDSVRWGEKSAMSASGLAKTVSPCSVELLGQYDWSETAVHVGRAYAFKGELAGERLTGEMFGAANEWVPMEFLRRPR